MAKKKGPVKKRYGSKKAEPVPNPFERLSSHKKFDVLGRKKLNGPQEKSRLRSAAHELRKNTLLVEYKQLRKSNAFIDRRFGEDDESLTADEKALLRFQKQRMQELAGGKFALPDDTQEVELTHLGRSLAESQGLGEDWQRDDEDDGLPDYDVSAHFGGGDGEGGDLFQLKPRSESAEVEGGDGDDAPAPRRSKAEVMEEVIAKSKAFRAAKQQQREEDVEEVEKLDSVFRELGAAGALSRLVRPKGAKGSLAGLESREDVAFDIAARELVYEAKGGPADRLKSQAELEAAENERAAKAEAALRRRLKAKDLGEGSDEDGEEVTDLLELPSGGFAARRAKAAAVAAAQGKKRKGGSGDALEDEDEFDLSASASEEGEDGEESASGSEDEEGGPLTALEARRRARAAGSDPLQAAFREAAKRLLKRHKGQAEGESEEDSEEEESGADEGDSGDDEGVEEGSGEEEEEEEVEAEEEAGGVSEDDSASEEEDEEERTIDVGRRLTTQPEPSIHPEAAVSGEQQAAPSMLQRLPTTYPEFARLVEGLSAAELHETVGALRVTHAAALARDNRAGMQTFYGQLTQHFASVAAAGGQDVSAALDALLPHLLELTAEVPLYAATLARARLSMWSARLGRRLADPGQRADAWPAPGVVAVLLLFLTLFPPSDRRHPVLTPVALLAGRCLTFCPVLTGRHLATGLALAGLLSAAHTPAQRFSPEALEFCARALRSVAAGWVGEDEDGEAEDGKEGRMRRTDMWLRLDSLAPLAEFRPPSLGELLAAGPAGSPDQRWEGADARTLLACVAARQAARCAEGLAGCDAAPEALRPALDALAAILAEDSAAVPEALRAEAGAAARTLEGAIARGLVARRPLVLAAAVRIAEARQYNPRFEDGYVATKDYDPDRERSERRKLQRQVRKEQRGAARELRKDGAFMAAVRDKEKATKQAALDKSAKRAMSFLQKQESDFKSGGQGGMWKKGKKF
ncbi:NOP14 [Auxenochlorella protothecoides x Auxenochlorella symbiontica]